MQSSDFASKILKTGIIHLCHRIPSGIWSLEMMQKYISIASAFCWVNNSACGTFAESESWLFSVCFDLWSGLECYYQDFSFYILSLLWFCGLRNVGSFPWFSWILQHCWLPGGETQTEEALYALPWKGHCELDQCWNCFKSNTGETLGRWGGAYNYRLSWEGTCHLGLNWIQ